MNLSDKEYDVLCSVLSELETQFDKDAEAQVEYADCDKNFVYLDVYYGDDNGEELKLRRELLSSKKSASEIASEVY